MFGFSAKPVLWVALVLVAGLAYGGYWLGASSHGTPNPYANSSKRYKSKQSKNSKQDQVPISVLVKKLGQTQARVLRLSVIGKRLIQAANIDPKKYNLDYPMGGPLVEDSSPANQSTIQKLLDEVQDELEKQEIQLAVLENMFIQMNLTKQIFPQGWPVVKGKISSYFGMRTHPISGKRTPHDGIDFAGEMGDNVISVAAGIVVFSGKTPGYGNRVDIQHGNGMVTRYAHNLKNLVRTGDRVEKGQVIAHMGKSGVTTGAHVHFEVLKNNNKINPIHLIEQAQLK